MHSPFADLIKNKRVAIVDDWLTSRGGTVEVVAALAEMFPDAPIYTSLYDAGVLPQFQDRIRTSYLQRTVPKFLRKKHQYFLHLMPSAFRKLDLSQYDIIISSSSAFAKCIRKTRPDQIHVCYCHTPIRYLYFKREEYLRTYSLPWYLRPVKRYIVPHFLDWLTRVDQRSIPGVDHFIANSDTVKERIKQYYRRDATTIYPPVNTETFMQDNPSQKKDYFYAHGRFVPYKMMPLIVETFADNGLPLQISGIGPDMERCQHIIAEKQATNIKLLGFVQDAELPKLYGEARAFIFPAEEDFGIVPVEAMAAGTPVIYYNAGGGVETVAEYGVPFEVQSKESLQAAIEKFIKEEKNFDPKNLQTRSQEFSQSVFKKKTQDFLVKIMN